MLKVVSLRNVTSPKLFFVPWLSTQEGFFFLNEQMNDIFINEYKRYPHNYIKGTKESSLTCKLNYNQKVNFQPKPRRELTVQSTQSNTSNKNNQSQMCSKSIPYVNHTTKTNNTADYKTAKQFHDSTCIRTPKPKCTPESQQHNSVDS